MIAIVNSGGANIASIVNAFERLGAQAQLTTDVDIIQRASHVILPGVGSAGTAMDQLNKYALVDVIKNLKQPVLGICLGMQLLYSHSDEGDVACLNIISYPVQKIQPQPGLTVPHMGWNNLHLEGDSPLMKGVSPKSYVYFVHSYAAPVTEHTVAVSNYGSAFAAAVQKDNFFGAQFHPERSGAVGAKILQNFLEL